MQHMNAKHVFYGLIVLLFGFALWSWIPLKIIYKKGLALEEFADMVEGSNLDRVKKKFSIKARKRQSAIDRKKALENDVPFDFTEQLKKEKDELIEKAKSFKTRIEGGESIEDLQKELEDENQKKEGEEEEKSPLDYDLENLHDFDINDKDKGGVYFLVLPAGGFIETERKRLGVSAKIIGDGLISVAKTLGETLTLRDNLEEMRVQVDRMNLYIISITLKSDEAVKFADSLLTTALNLGMIDGSTQSVQRYGESLFSAVRAAIKTRNRNEFEDVKEEIEIFADRLDEHPSIAILAKKVERMKKITADITNEIENFTRMWNIASDRLMTVPDWNRPVERVIDARKKTLGPLVDLFLDVENFYEPNINVISSRHNIEGLGRAIQNFKPTPFHKKAETTESTGGISGGSEAISEEDNRVLVNDFNALRKLVERAVMIFQKLKNESMKATASIQNTLEAYEKYKKSIGRMNENIKDAALQQMMQDSAVDELSKVIGTNRNLKIKQKINELQNTQIQIIREIERLEAIPNLFHDGSGVIEVEEEDEDELGDWEEEEEVVVEEEDIMVEEEEGVMVEEEKDGESGMMMEKEKVEDEDEEEEDEDEEEDVVVEEEEDVVVEEEEDEGLFMTLMALNKKSLILSREITQAYEDIHQRARDVKDFGDAFNVTIKVLGYQWDVDFFAYFLEFQSAVKELTDVLDVYEDKVVNSYDGCGITLIRIEEFLGNPKQEMLSKYEADEMLYLYIDVMAVDGDREEISISQIEQKVKLLAAEYAI